jgi:hypothetical protein
VCVCVCVCIYIYVYIYIVRAQTLFAVVTLQRVMRTSAYTHTFIHTYIHTYIYVCTTTRHTRRSRLHTQHTTRPCQKMQDSPRSAHIRPSKFCNATAREEKNLSSQRYRQSIRKLTRKLTFQICAAHAFGSPQCCCSAARYRIPTYYAIFDHSMKLLANTM